MEIHHTKLKEMLSDYYKQGYEKGFTDTIMRAKKYAVDYVDNNSEHLSRVRHVIHQLINTLLEEYNAYPCIKQIYIQEDIEQ